MTHTPTPGQVCYEAFDAAFPADRFVRLTWDEQAPAVQAAWDAAALAVLVADSDGRHTTTAFFRYAIGDVLRLGSLGPWTVQMRRWIERSLMPPYAEYLVELEPEGVTQWEVEADLEPWEETTLG